MSSVLWSHIWPVINLAGLGFFTSLAVTGFMVIAGLGDTPNARSNHNKVTPSAGGVGLVAAFGVCSLALVLLHPYLLDVLPKNFPQILSLIFAMALLGLCDDVFELSARLKFGIMIFLSGLGAWSVGFPTVLPNGNSFITVGPYLGLIGASLWIFVVVNAVNFMDGANGLITNSLVIASVAMGVIGLSAGSVLSAFLCGVLIVGFLGFLPYNQRKRAAIFCGDTGALLAGFCFALASLSAVNSEGGDSFLYLGPLLILPLLADVLLTLASRAKRRQNLLQAHRDHLYQRLIKRGFSHLSVTWFYSLASLIFANIAIYAMQSGRVSSPLFLAVNVSGIMIVYAVVSRLVRRQSP